MAVATPCCKLTVITATPHPQAKSEKRLLVLDFVTVHDYLFILREVVTLLTPYDRRVLLFLAAAVSDFFIPISKLVRACV